MRGVSRTSHAEVAERLEALLDRTPDAAARTRLGEELFAVTDLLDSSVSLRRSLTDASRRGEDKARLVERLLGGKVSADAVDLLSGAVRARWSEARDLAASTELLGVDAVLAAAEAEGRLDAVEQEVDRAGQLLAGDRGVRSALSRREGTARAKARLVERLVGGALGEESRVLVTRMAAHPRGRRPEDAFELVSRAAAERRQRLVARVTVATWPTDEQQQRLVAALSSAYGRTVRLAIDVDPDVVGGMRVQVGDEVRDGTVVRRLHAAAEQLGR
ncbi:F0F1 ATP synthase subunit delta [Aquipuribacter nitratireducens]|uniref:ATP synthase subunit delta n=1 Tax=Aquipuribacter nitratireducens TaxID=650104 RepID=A0ABW0GMB2_9MICO